MIRSSDWPIACSAACPKIRSAPAFQNLMTPPVSAATIASGPDKIACAMDCSSTPVPFLLCAACSVQSPRRPAGQRGVGSDGQQDPALVGQGLQVLGVVRDPH